MGRWCTWAERRWERRRKVREGQGVEGGGKEVKMSVRE